MRTKPLYYLATMFNVLLFLAFPYLSIDEHIACAKGNKYPSIRLQYILDGDSIIIYDSGKKRTIRLYGIDAPELSQRYGRKAKKALTQALHNAKLSIQYITKDVHSRDIAIVYANGKDINRYMLQEGNAYWYRLFCTQYPLCKTYKEEEQKARKAHRGLWKNPANETPAQYRKRTRKH